MDLSPPNQFGTQQLPGKYMSKIYILGSVAFLFFLVGCQQSDSVESTPAPVPVVPDVLPRANALKASAPAPDFSIPGLDGDTLRFADFRGKTVLLNFWATWCGPCVVEIPDLIALQEELGHESFAVIGVSMDMTGIEDVKAFVESMNVNYPIGIDEGFVAEAFGGIFSLPTTYVIDKNGIIRQRTIGIFPAEAFKPHLISMIEAD